MCQPLISRNRTCLLASVATCLLSWQSFLLSADELPFPADDIRQDAIASREGLVSDIAKVPGVALRARLLEFACDGAVDCRLAHWYTAQVQVDGKWVSLEEAQSLAAENGVLAEYYQLRARSGDSLKDHEKLAQWCRKHELAELEKMHWLQVIRIQPHQPAALNALDLRWHDGILLTVAELKKLESQERLTYRQRKQWKSKAKQIRRALEHGEPSERMAARSELREIRAPAAVPALLQEFRAEAPTKQRTIDLQSELMASLGNIPAPAAVEALVESAVFSPAESVRYAAVDQLRSKKFEEYVPLLLSELQMPVEGSVSIHEVGNQIVSSYSYSQEGPAGQEYEQDYDSYQTIPGRRFLAMPVHKKHVTPSKLVQAGYWEPERIRPAFMCNGHLMPAARIPARYVQPRYSAERTDYEQVGTIHADDPYFESNKRHTVERSQRRAQETARELTQKNQQIHQRNEHLVEVLTELTGERFEASPKSWWNWWGEYLDRHPDVAATGMRQELNRALLNQDSRGLARGTWVWTRQGLRAVELLRPGDYVLAQHPTSGELAYQVILAVRAPVQITVNKIDLGEDALHCAPGHVVWVSGLGWQRVLALDINQHLHGVRDESKITAVGEAFSIDSYDLVVDGFHTFFIGQPGILVHDATPIRPAFDALPGFSPAAVADAARLAAAH